MEKVVVRSETKALLAALKEDLGLRNFDEALQFLLEQYSEKTGWHPSVFALRRVAQLYGIVEERRRGHEGQRP